MTFNGFSATVGHITSALPELKHGASERGLGPDVLEQGYNRLAATFDERYGGFGSAPKFPTPHTMLFLLRWWKRSGHRDALSMVEHTLTTMARSGIFDHVGFGFHRYSTDREWKLPHFEKMLYDQALLLRAYTEAFQATAKPEYANTARRVCTYVLRDLTSAEGAFFSAENAESEGEEGKFYLWSLAALSKALDPDDLELAVSVYGLREEGNFAAEAGQNTSGANVLHRARSLDDLANDLGRARQDLERRLERIRERLYAAREARVRPSLDDKILTDWNGLMLAALAKAGQVLAEPAYVRAAEDAAAFILSRLVDEEGKLLHRYRRGQAGIGAYHAAHRGGLLDRSFVRSGDRRRRRAGGHAHRARTSLCPEQSRAQTSSRRRPAHRRARALCGAADRPGRQSHRLRLPKLRVCPSHDRARRHARAFGLHAGTERSTRRQTMIGLGSV